VELALGLRHRLAAPSMAGTTDKQEVRITLVTGGPVPLAGYTAGVIRRMQRVLAAQAIAVVRDNCTAVEAGALALGSGARLACHAAVIATGAEAPAWLAGSGLALDERGFVRTGATLQSLSHPEVFAAGDVATRADAPHAKSGVYAVRAGPPLALNLRRFLTGGELQPHRPQQRTLNLISCGEKRAIAAWGGWSAQGRWVWWWKDRIDRSFVARYSAPAAAVPS